MAAAEAGLIGLVEQGGNAQRSAEHLLEALIPRLPCLNKRHQLLNDAMSRGRLRNWSYSRIFTVAPPVPGGHRGGAHIVEGRSRCKASENQDQLPHSHG